LKINPDMSTLFQFEEQTINALVWTIVHSLWQFTLIGVVMSVFLKLYQHKESKIRYRLALSSLFLSIIAAACTFLYYQMANESINSNEVFISSVIQINPANGEKDITTSLFAWIDAYHTPIFFTWLVGVILFSIKFIFSLGYVEFLSRTSIPLCCQDTYRSFRKVCNYYRIGDNIRIGESKYVKSPMILGIIKPVILFPVGILNQLDLKETEAILAHELAHFIRKDIYINIIQTLIEVLFYYHPAIWWISANIRLEREICCDDLAVSFLGNNIQYAKTLVKMQDIYITGTSPQLALNFSKKESFFSNRIKRILNMAQTRNYLREKIITSLILIGLVMLFTKDLTGTSVNPFAENETITTVKDTIPYQNESIRIQKKTNDKEIKISLENGKVTDLEIDGKKIEEKDFDKFEEIISEVKPGIKDKGKSHMFYFGHDGQPFGFNFGRSEDMDSLFRGFGNFDALKGMDGIRSFEDMEALKELEKLGFQQGKLNEHLQKLQDHLGNMQFNFNFPDSLNFDSDRFAFPEIKEWEGFPNFKYFDFDSEAPDQFYFNRKFPDEMPDYMDDLSTYDNHHGTKNFSDIIGNSLNRDGLLLPGQENKVELTGKHLKINGEKQPSNIYQKYKRIFEEQSGTVLEKNSRLEFSFLGKESKRKYKVY